MIALATHSVQQLPLLPSLPLKTTPPPPPPSNENSLQMAAKKGAKAPPARAVSSNAVDGLVGYDIETGGPFDPLGFGKNCPPEQMQWYRAAELKHGRVCMLATLGQITQHFTHWNDPSGIFDKSDSAWGAMQQVRSFSRASGRVCNSCLLGLRTDCSSKRRFFVTGRF